MDYAHPKPIKYLFLFSLLIPLLLSACSSTCIQGDCTNGVGTRFLDNGDRYEGEWLRGKRHGHGTATSADGDTYVGEWKNGKIEGTGTMLQAQWQTIRWRLERRGQSRTWPDDIPWRV